MRLVVLILPVVLAACGTSSPSFESPEHDFALHAIERPPERNVAETPHRRPDLSKLVAAAKRRFSAPSELEGLLDPAAQTALAKTPWLDHPELHSKRAGLRAAITEYDQARELEDLLSSYRSLREPGTPEQPIISPHVESLRGRMADFGAEKAWHELRGAIVARAAGIIEAQASLVYSNAKVSITQNHLSLIGDLIPVVRARTGTGGSRQADWLAFRSERAAVAARLEAFKALRESAAHALREAANATTDMAVSIPKLEGELPSASELSSVALAHQPSLLAMRAKLKRRQTGLRLADLAASESPRMPGGGVRSAIRRELRDRIDALARRVSATELSLSARVAAVRGRLIGARAQVRALSTQSVPDARKALADLRASYAGRRASFLDVFRAARRRLDVELELARAIHDRTQAEAALFRTLGRRTP